MASPINAQSPPPFPPNKRRISVPGTAGTGSTKKSKTSVGNNVKPLSRKNSIAALTPKPSHPLRQTSFPPDEAAARLRRSPSVASNATTSFTRANSVDRQLVPIGTTKTTVGGEEEDGEEDDEDGRDDFGASGQLDTLAEADRVKAEELAYQNFAELLDMFNEDQMLRYEAFRRSNLNKPAVKKIANQVLSQSITPSVATSISGFAKMFASDIIERAREIQAQWGDDEPGAPLMPDHLREAARRWRMKEGKTANDPVAAMETLSRPRMVGGLGGRLFK